MYKITGDDLDQYIKVLGWTIDPTTNVVTISPNPDNHIEATVVQETIKLSRMLTS
jgi:translation initiation factor 3 subunit K